MLLAQANNKSSQSLQLLNLEPFSALFSIDIIVWVKNSKEIASLKQQYHNKIRRQTTWALVSSSTIKIYVMYLQM